jgi:hypothetical protein
MNINPEKVWCMKLLFRKNVLNSSVEWQSTELGNKLFPLSHKIITIKVVSTHFPALYMYKYAFNFLFEPIEHTPWHWIEVGGQLHSLVALPPGK